MRKIPLRPCILRLAVLLLFVPPLLGAAGSQEGGSAEEVTLFVAASTTDIMEAIAHRFEESHGVRVHLSSASSGTLARQIEQGGRPDLYVSASTAWMEYVEALGQVRRSTPFARNRLVVIAPEQSELSPFELNREANLPELTSGLVAIGDPGHVPAGVYAREALEYYGWYLRMEDRLITTANVRAALALVELDEVDLGIVYETDALKSARVRVLATFPEASHRPIEYYCALLDTDSPVAAELFSFIREDPWVEELLVSNGFTLRH